MVCVLTTWKSSGGLLSINDDIRSISSMSSTSKTHASRVPNPRSSSGRSSSDSSVSEVLGMRPFSISYNRVTIIINDQTLR